MDNAMIESYVAQKMRTIDKTLADMSYQAEKLIISDVVPGKRTIVSKNASMDPELMSLTRPHLKAMPELSTRCPSGRSRM